MKVDGLHHVTAITADVEANLNFYGRLLGLRLVWQGVHADDPEMRHVAYGDERGSPGSIVTFFDMPGVAPGRPGSGMADRLLLPAADAKALDFWERRLARTAPTPRAACPCSVTCSGRRPGAREAGWRGERRHSLVIYDVSPEEPGHVGAGTAHHIAFAIRDGDEQRWRDQVAAAQLRLTPVMDRKMNKSVYVASPAASCSSSRPTSPDSCSSASRPWRTRVLERPAGRSRADRTPINARHGRNQGGKR
jgi:catechol 2,3-dioxygenase-like lactoylglutathione lyase family enzyme